MTDAMTPYSPSMRLDYDFHRRMEIYYLTPALWRLPARQAVRCPNWRCWRRSCGSWKKHAYNSYTNPYFSCSFRREPSTFI